MAKCKTCGTEDDMIFGGQCLDCSQGTREPQRGHWQDSLDPESGPGDDTLPGWMFDKSAKQEKGRN